MKRTLLSVILLTVLITSATSVYAQTAKQAAQAQYTALTLSISLANIKSNYISATNGPTNRINALIDELEPQLSENQEFIDLKSEWLDLDCTFQWAEAYKTLATSYESNGLLEFNLGQYWEMQPDEYSGDYHYIIAYHLFQDGCYAVGTAFNYYIEFINEAEGTNGTSIEERLTVLKNNLP